MTPSQTDLAIIGAGPYGLSLAAHLKHSRCGLQDLRLTDEVLARHGLRASLSSHSTSRPMCTHRRRAIDSSSTAATETSTRTNPAR